MILTMCYAGEFRRHTLNVTAIPEERKALLRDFFMPAPPLMPPAELPLVWDKPLEGLDFSTPLSTSLSVSAIAFEWTILL